MPYAYWPLIDAAGSTQASNYAPGNSKPLIVTQSKYGAGNVTQAFGGNSSALLGAQSTVLISSSVRTQSEAGMWTLSGASSASPPLGYSLTCTDTGFPAISGGVTIEMFVQSTSPYSTVDQSVFTVLAGPKPLFQIYWFAHPTGIFALNQGAAINTIQGTNTTDYCNGQLVHLAFSFNQTTWTSYIDGAFAATGSFSPSLPAEWSQLVVNGVCGLTQGVYSVFDAMNFNGYTGHVAVFGYEVSPLRIATHYQAGVTGMAGDTSSARIERLLQAAPLLNRRVILQEGGTAQTLTASCQDIGGQPAATSLANIDANVKPGGLLVTPPGEIYFLAKEYAWNQQIRWTLGDNWQQGMIPFTPTGFGFSYDSLRVVNDIQLTQLDNLDIITPSGNAETLALASQLQYGDQPYWQTGYLQGDLTEPLTFGPGLEDLANWIAETNGKPRTRVIGLTVDAASHPSAWPFVMQAAVGDMVTVNVAPATTTASYQVTGRISQTQRTLSFNQESTTGSIALLIDSAPESSALTLDDPVRGLLNGQNCLAW